jgi:RNA recognition motif-containing protein
MNIYVGNLSPEATEKDVRHAFEGFGQVASDRIIKDKVSGQSRGFGFVEMLNKTEAHAAISGLNRKELKGQQIIVNEARPRPEGRRGDEKSSVHSLLDKLLWCGKSETPISSVIGRQ